MISPGAISQIGEAEISDIVRRGNYDLLIGLGGGSTMDTTKVVSVTALTGMSIKDYIGTISHEKIYEREKHAIELFCSRDTDEKDIARIPKKSL